MAFEYVCIYCVHRKNAKGALELSRLLNPSILRVLVEAVRPRRYWWNATAPHLASSHKCGPESQAFDGRPALPNIIEPKAVVDPPVPEPAKLAYLLSDLGQESKPV
jgi:hypothetical protein